VIEKKNRLICGGREMYEKNENEYKFTIVYLIYDQKE